MEKMHQYYSHTKTEFRASEQLPWSAIVRVVIQKAKGLEYIEARPLPRAIQETGHSLFPSHPPGRPPTEDKIVR
jgi:hypothetical protein